MVAATVVWPLGPAEPVGDLLALLEDAGIQFRHVRGLQPVMDEIAASTLRFSGIRMRNANRESETRTFCPPSAVRVDLG